MIAAPFEARIASILDFATAAVLAEPFQKSVAVRVSDIYAYFNSRPQAFRADMITVFDLQARGVLRQVYLAAVERCPEAHRRLDSRESTGMIVITFD